MDWILSVQDQAVPLSGRVSAQGSSLEHRPTEAHGPSALFESGPTLPLRSFSSEVLLRDMSYAWKGDLLPGVGCGMRSAGVRAFTDFCLPDSYGPLRG